MAKAASPASPPLISIAMRNHSQLARRNYNEPQHSPNSIRWPSIHRWDARNLESLGVHEVQYVWALSYYSTVMLSRAEKPEATFGIEIYTKCVPRITIKTETRRIIPKYRDVTTRFELIKSV
ncbi:hypothetical protein NPIL_633321 [Nephila pilipes]|uniref:Uncharacterized protein n=1 Tax=Nephila pilipes TaxID=299642 RepID=A0A8X6NV04_NEPPI|nr:hypothetical protein NPIL_633321 [Nephila pilipes]